MPQERRGGCPLPSVVTASAVVADPPFAGVKVWLVREIEIPSLLPGLVRRELAEWMGSTHEALGDLQTIATELVTNALIHANAEWVRVHLIPESGFWRLTVVDPGRNGLVPHPRITAETDEWGRGLRMVHGLTSGAWGTNATLLGERVVWALVPRLGGQSDGRRS
ncbi:ATP-binding protein [Actinomadura sp. ATCC 39365]